MCNNSTPAAEALCTRDSAASNAPYCSTFPAGAQWHPIPQGAPCEAAEATEAAQAPEAHPDADTCRPD